MALSKQEAVKLYLTEKFDQEQTDHTGLDELVALLLLTKAQQKATLVAWLEARRQAVADAAAQTDAAAAATKAALQQQAADITAVESQL